MRIIFSFSIVLTLSSFAFGEEINDLIQSISLVWAGEGEPGMEEAYDSLEINIEKLEKYYKSNYDNLKIPLTLHKAYECLIEKLNYNLLSVNIKWLICQFNYSICQ